MSIGKNVKVNYLVIDDDLYVQNVAPTREYARFVKNEGEKIIQLKESNGKLEVKRVR